MKATITIQCPSCEKDIPVKDIIDAMMDAVTPPKKVKK